MISLLDFGCINRSILILLSELCALSGENIGTVCTIKTARAS